MFTPNNQTNTTILIVFVHLKRFVFAVVSCKFYKDTKMSVYLSVLMPSLSCSNFHKNYSNVEVDSSIFPFKKDILYIIFVQGHKKSEYITPTNFLKMIKLQ